LQFLTNKIWVCVNIWAQYGGQHYKCSILLLFGV
jgi:hypothetical protein